MFIYNNIVTTLAQEVGLEIFVIVTSTIVLSRTLLLLFHAQRTSGPRAGRTMQPVDEFLTVKFSFFEVALPPWTRDLVRRSERPLVA